MRSRLSRLQQQAPFLLGMLLIVLMCTSLAWQTLGWFRLAHIPPTGVDMPPPSDHQQHAAPAQLAALFGAVAQENGPPPTTNLHLTLLGSFVHADPQRSSAIVQREGSASQRVVIGSELADGGERLVGEQDAEDHPAADLVDDLLVDGARIGGIDSEDHGGSVVVY